jgi:formaldehyde-activating enzyme involved in methanogenesis
MPIRRLLQNIVFGPPQIAIMTAVFDAVCLDLGLTAGNPQREAVAKAIINCAQTGELDPIKLRVAALGAIKP